MQRNILLDGREFHFGTSFLPTLIHGVEGSGASFFTMTMLADLYTQGLSVIALTGYPMAKEEFLRQTGSDARTQFFTKDRSEAFIASVKKTTENTVILVKNIELFPEEVFTQVESFKIVIFSGDVTTCAFKDQLRHKIFATTIYFSPLGDIQPTLPKYAGWLRADGHEGVVTLAE